MTHAECEIIERRGLEGTERAAAMALTELCNKHDGLDMPVALDAEAGSQLLLRERGALTGLATLQDGSDGTEVCLLVHPEQRRRGLGRVLLDAARAVCATRGEAELLLVCQEPAPAGHAFVAAVGGAPRHAEHRMVLDPAVVDRSRPSPAGYRLRAADAADRALLERLQAGVFGDTREEVQEYIAAGLADRTRQYFVGEVQGEAIGLLRLGRYERDADITAFGVVPEWRARGYGRAMLHDAVDILLAERWERIIIEVFSDNERALGLYESCGFRVTSSYAFYTFAL